MRIQFPCPWCGDERHIYVATSRRGPGTKGGHHRPGEWRTKRERRATCGKKRCKTLQRAATLHAKHRKVPR